MHVEQYSIDHAVMSTAMLTRCPELLIDCTSAAASSSEGTKLLPLNHVDRGRCALRRCGPMATPLPVPPVDGEYGVPVRVQPRPTVGEAL